MLRKRRKQLVCCYRLQNTRSVTKFTRRWTASSEILVIQKGAKHSVYRHHAVGVCFLPGRQRKSSRLVLLVSWRYTLPKQSYQHSPHRAAEDGTHLKLNIPE
jgi:hypothetical protein